MAFAAVCAQRDLKTEKRNAMIILEGKINRAKGELLKLKNSYDTAIDDIQTHHMNACAALTSIKESAEKALDAYMLEHQRRLRDSLEKMEELRKKMNAEAHNENNSTSIRGNDGHLLSSILEIHLETLPNIRFVGNEAFLFRVVNGNHLPYFGSITMDNKLLARDLHLHLDFDSQANVYTFNIDVPKGAAECEDLKSRIKCEVFQKDTGTSISLSPVWITDHFEVRFGLPKKNPFSVGVYLLDQHISGSPAHINSDDLLGKEACSNMEVVKAPAKRRITAPDPIIEAALQEINSNSDPNNNSISEPSKARLMTADGVFKISKKTKIPCTPGSNTSLKRHCQVPQTAPQEKDASMEESGASCHSLTTRARPGTPQGKHSASSANFFQKQIANIIKEKQGTGETNPVEEQLRKPFDTVRVKLEANPTNTVKETQGSHLAPQEKDASMEESSAPCHSSTTRARPGTPQGKHCAASANFFQKQIASIIKEKQGAGESSPVKGQLRKPLDTVRVKLEASPANTVKETQGSHLVKETEKIPCPRPALCDEKGTRPKAVAKLDFSLCPSSVPCIKEELVEEQCSPRSWEEPAHTTAAQSVHHENSSKKICFPNRHIRHSFHPDVCLSQEKDHPESAPNGLPKILARLAKIRPKKQADFGNNKSSLVKDLRVTIGNNKSSPVKDLRVTINRNNTFFNENEAKSRKVLNGPTDNFMINTMSFNVVEAHLVYTTSIESPFALDRPVGVLEHSSGSILVSDTFNDRVLRLDGTGGPIGVAGPSMGFRRPSGLVELGDGSVAVICSNFMAMFDADGNYLKVLGKQLLQKPYGLCLNEEDKLMTVETAYLGTLVIVTICPELELELSRVRVPLQLQPQRVELSKPRFISSYKDKLYVGDLGLNCVYEVNYTTGCLLNTFGSTGTAPGCMVDPSGITCDRDGNIYVADSRNHRIQVFDTCRRVICIIDMDYPLNRPSGICLTEGDDLFVLNYWDNSLAKYHLKYKQV